MKQPPPPQMNPLMDPTYMYYMMAAAAAAAYNPNPFAYPAYGGYPPLYQPPPMSNNRSFYPEDDRQSYKSYQFDDNRSEKQFDPRATRSIAGDHILKQVPQVQSQGLLMPDQKLTEDIDQEMSQLNLNQMPFKQEESVVLKEVEKVNRMTPQLHQLPHVRCSFSFNNLIRVRPNDPCDGQPALVDLFNLSDFMDNYLSNVKKSQTAIVENEDEYKSNDLDNFNYMNDDARNEILINYKLLQEFPGPLSKDSNTSKAQVIQFCLKNVKECLASNTSLIDPQSHALLWDFLALLVRQNGLIDLKTDVSPLLMSGLVNNPEQNDVIKNSESTQSLTQQQDFVMIQQKENEATTSSDELVNLNRLRQLLGAGQKSDAIEYTIKHNMWPHALFLASSTSNTSSQTQSLNETKHSLSNTNISQSVVQNESKTLSKVKLRFISSLPQNDPILTCYQLLMGRVPTAASVSLF